jgi:hypothetical protein
MTCKYCTLAPSNGILVAIWFPKHRGKLLLRLLTCGKFCSIKFLKLYKPYSFLSCDRELSMYFARCNELLFSWICSLRRKFLLVIYSLWLFIYNQSLLQLALAFKTRNNESGCVKCSKTSVYLTVQFTWIIWCLVKSLFYHLWSTHSCSRKWHYQPPQ